MKTIRILFITVTLFQFTILKADSSDWMANVCEILADNGPAYSFPYDDIFRDLLAKHEEEVGYEKCCQDYFEALCRTAEESTQRNDSKMFELCMCRDFMAWQYGSISSKKALTKMRKILEACRLQMGDKSYSTITASCIMAEFYCALGKYDDAYNCCHWIVDNNSDDMIIYQWQYSIALHAEMVAKVGNGMFSEAWSTAGEIVSRYNKSDLRNCELDVYPVDDDMDEKGMPSSVEIKEVERLARQMSLQFFPLPVKAVEMYDIEPWPLFMPKIIMDSKTVGILGVINLHELLLSLRLPKKIYYTIGESMRSLVSDIYDYYITNNDASISLLPLAVELYRRSAQANTHSKNFYNTNDNDDANNYIDSWRRLGCVEQLNNGKSSALPKLYVVGDYIKEGGPLSVLPFAEEATETMQQEFSEKKLTQRQLVLLRHNREWLKVCLPEIANAVANLPEYENVILDLQSLRKTYVP